MYRFELREQRLGIVAGQMAELEIERAFVRHDVKRRAAAHDAGMHGRVRNVEAAIIRPLIAMAARH